MGERIRLLEDALGELQARHSGEPHPLLLNISSRGMDVGKDGGIDEDDGDAGSGGVQHEKQRQQQVIDALGTLSISEHGIARFFGPTGGSESLLLANLDASSSSSSPPLASSSTATTTTTTGRGLTTIDMSSPESIPTPDTAPSVHSGLAPDDSLALFSNAFPFTPVGIPPDVLHIVKSHLPSYARAETLCQIYFDKIAWVFHCVMRDQVLDDMLPVIYERRDGTGEWDGPHDLALVFVIMSIASLVADPSDEERLTKKSAEGLGEGTFEGGLFPFGTPDSYGEHFHQIARAALALQSVLEKPSLVTIQSLHLLSIYNAMSGSDVKSETSMELTWSLVTLACHLSQTIGLHRDSARWGLDEKTVQRRRVLFWDLFTADVWQSLNTGRPPSFSLAYIDCTFPSFGLEDEDAPSYASFQSWQCRFAAECVAEVTAKTLTTEPPSYSVIMDLDRKVREFPLPDGTEKDTSPSGVFSRCVLDHIKETVLMYLHRSFFAQAIIENPTNPLKSAYAPSYLAAYRASSTILKCVKEQYNMVPEACGRFWTMWTFAFSAAVVVGTVVARGPKSPLAGPAMSEMEGAVTLFGKAAGASVRAAKALPVLVRLCDKGRLAVAGAGGTTSGTISTATMAGLEEMALSSGMAGATATKEDGVEDTPELGDELDIIAGRTRFVGSGSRKEAPQPTSHPSSSHPQQPLPHTNSNLYPPVPLSASASTSTTSSTSGGDFGMYEYDYTPPSSASSSLPPHLPPTPAGAATALGYVWGSNPTGSTSDGYGGPGGRSDYMSMNGHGHGQEGLSVSPSAPHPLPSSSMPSAPPSQQNPPQPASLHEGRRTSADPYAIYRGVGVGVSGVHGHGDGGFVGVGVGMRSGYSIGGVGLYSSGYGGGMPSQSGLNGRQNHNYQTPISHHSNADAYGHAHPHGIHHPPPPPPPGLHDYSQPHLHSHPHPHSHPQSQPYPGVQDSLHLPPHAHAHAHALGLASRDSRLDERWSSFMADTGVLEGYAQGGGDGAGLSMGAAGKRAIPRGRKPRQ